MQIVAINPSRNSQQVWLKFSDGSILPLRIDDLVTLKLSKHTDITEEKFNQIKNSSAGFLLLEYSLRQIAISPRVENILRQKLRIYCQKLIYKYGFSLDLLSPLVENVIAKLDSQNLLDQQPYIKYIVRKFPKKSVFELKYLFGRLGINYSPIQDITAEITKIKNLITRRYFRVDLTDYYQRNKLIANLNHKGFPVDLIKTAIDETVKVR